MKFWTAAARQKLDWVEKMREKHGYVIGVVGGSTTAFGIDAEYIERVHGFPMANLGLHVGMGPAALIGFGLSSLRAGDTLVLSLEPSILTEQHSKESTLGTKLALMLTKPEMLAWNQGIYGFPNVEALAAVPPGGYHVMTMLGKIVMGKPLYRYNIQNLRTGGLIVTEEIRNFSEAMDFSSPASLGTLSCQGSSLLREAQAAADIKGINLLYVLPVSYWLPENAAQRRTANAELLNMIGTNVRVLAEQSMGVHTELGDFTDSGQHLCERAARIRSRQLADRLTDYIADNPLQGGHPNSDKPRP
jgi:hypothetical protein